MSTRFNLQRLIRELAGFVHHELDIRDRTGVSRLIEEVRPSVIIHCAAQPSHDRPRKSPSMISTSTPQDNQPPGGRPHILPESSFVHVSTNKVYGDRPNTIALEESTTRWDFADPDFQQGIPEDFPIDQSKHSLFGASKVAADSLVQEYGRTFRHAELLSAMRLPRGSEPCGRGVARIPRLSDPVQRRGPPLQGLRLQRQTGPRQHPCERCRSLHVEFIEKPRIAEVYNLGGGRQNSCSILEAFALAEKFSGRQNYVILEDSRIGDHVCYYSDLRKNEGALSGLGAKYFASEHC